jgi:hypothetical protein
MLEPQPLYLQPIKSRTSRCKSSPALGLHVLAKSAVRCYLRCCPLMSNVPWLMKPIYNASKIFGNIIILFASQIGTWRSDVLTARALQSWQMIFPLSNAPTVPLIWLMANMSSTSHTRTRATATYFQITNRVKSKTPHRTVIESFVWAINESAGSDLWHLSADYRTHSEYSDIISIAKQYIYEVIAMEGITSYISMQTSCTGASVHNLTLIRWNRCMKFIKYKITENRQVPQAVQYAQEVCAELWIRR